MTQGHSAYGNGRGSTWWGLPLSLGLYALAVASLAGACLYFFLAYVPGRRAAAIKAWQQELVVRDDLHKMTLDHWVAVGMADADILAAYPTPRALIADREGTLTASRAADAAAHLREVAERFARMRGYHRFVLLDANLRIVVGVGAAAQIERSDLQTAAEVLAQGKTIVDFHRYADGRVAVVFLARVGADTASRTGGGVVLLEADPSKWLYPYLGLRPIAAGSAETVLMRREGEDIVFLSPLRHNPAPPLTFRRPANVMGFAALAAVEGHEGFDAFVDYRGEPVFAAVARLDRAPWGIVVKIDQREVLAGYQHEVRHTGATAAMAILALWALVLLLIRAWRRRVELRLEVEHSLLRAMINRPDDVIVFSLDANYCYTVFNEKHRLEMKKVWNADIRVGMSLLDCMTAPELRRLAKLSIDRALHGEAFWEEQHQPDLDVYYEFSWNPILLGTKIVGVAVFIRDISERKRAEAALATANIELEQRVAERTAELLASNQELESFAYAVSHDLRAPLRGIDGWSQAVLEDCGAQLDEQGRKYLRTVRVETQRMAQLIDDLLELSRVIRAPMKRESVDLTAMAQELDASLRANQPERAVDFVVAPKMVAVGDAGLLRAALQNLLQNAWKFTGKRPRARIEVGCVSEEGRTVYHVRDDGAGFDMRYAGKLFAPFQRLHSLDEFAGTGIGLATVQRIIHRHGGKVWATAEVDQGATFYFTLAA